MSRGPSAEQCNGVPQVGEGAATGAADERSGKRVPSRGVQETGLLSVPQLSVQQQQGPQTKSRGDTVVKRVIIMTEDEAVLSLPMSFCGRWEEVDQELG